MKNGHRDLGRMVKEFRLSRTMTQLEASAFFGVSYATYMRVENGRGRFSELTIARITNKLKELEAA